MTTDLRHPGVLVLAALLLGVLLPRGRAVADQAPKRADVAFYYGADVPHELAVAHAHLVVEPGHVPDPRFIAEAGATPVAYLSIGEVAETDPAARQLSAAWTLARNAGWNSRVMDLRAAGYRSFLLSRFEGLWAAGYRGFFLDTLDSYQLAPAADRPALQRALASLLRALHDKHPDAVLLLNRGFEVLPDVSDIAAGVVAESLFDRYDAGKRQYTRVPEADRRWLTDKLHEVQRRYGLPVTVIDYRPESERVEARRTASRIAALGFSPWVTDAALTSMGVGQREVVPRRVLVISDDAASREPGAPSEPLRRLSPVLEYLGQVPEGYDLSTGLPPRVRPGRVAGVVTWLTSGAVPTGYTEWLREVVAADVPLVIFGQPGFALDGPLAEHLGLRVQTGGRSAQRPGSTLQRDALVGFEAEPPGRPLETTALSLDDPQGRVHLSVADSYGRPGVAIATTSFGGLALSHVLALRGLAGERAWVMDPYAFLEQALRLWALPRPDVTTEYGRRVAVMVVRAHGLADRARVPGTPRTVSLLKQKLLQPSGLPHTLETRPEDEAEAPPAAVRAAAQLGRDLPIQVVPIALSPSDSDARRPHRSLTHLGSARGHDPLRPAAAPTALDSRYIGDAPEAYPYGQVLQTLRFTDGPRRVAPLGLHYHAWSAASVGGLQTLQDLYAYIADQHPQGLFAADYAARVQAFYDVVLTRALDGSYAMHGGQALRTLRLPEGLGAVDLAASEGVATYTELAQGRYLSFVAEGPRRVALSAAASDPGPVLRATNGQVQHLTREHAELSLQVTGHGPLQLQFAGLPPATPCVLRYRRRSARATADVDGRVTFDLPATATGPAVLHCDSREETP